MAAEHVTSTSTNFWGYGSDKPVLCLTNSIILGSFGTNTVISNTCVAINPAGTIFQSVAGGNFYLADNSPYRDTGTPFISLAAKGLIAAGTTFPPSFVTNNFYSNNTLVPLVVRDVYSPDYGYHYAPLDFVVSNNTISFGSLTLTNGVAVGAFGTNGLTVGSFSAGLVSQGSPVNLNRLVPCAAVQELVTNRLTTLIRPTGSGGTIDLRFTELPLLGGSSYFINLDDPGVANYGTIKLRDCQLGGGIFYVRLGAATDGEGEASSITVTLTNNLFNRCATTFYRYYNNPAALNLVQYNNLYHGGTLKLEHDAGYTGDTNPPTWTIRDNLFEGVAINYFYSTSAYVVNDHNGYFNATPLSNSGGSDVSRTNADFQSGPLGRWYYPTTGTNLAALINAGSRSAANAGLYHFTVTTNEIKDSTNVDIGYHFVALDGDGKPDDTDNDGIADYLEDRNGNGSYESGTDIANWLVLDTDNDGVADGTELLNGTDPVSSSSVSNVQLGLWRFNTSTWLGEQGQQPLTNVGLGSALRSGIEASAIDMNTAGSSKLLCFRETETNGQININLRQGTIRFWFNPGFNSASNGGAGPGHAAQMINVGGWTSNASIGSWRIQLDSTGDNISLDAQDNSGHSVSLPWGGIPGGLVSNSWRQIAAVYSASNAAIYVDGVLSCSNAGLSNIYPPLAIRAQGFYIGSDSAGGLNCVGSFDLLDTYNYPMGPASITVYTNQSVAGPPAVVTNISIANPVDVKYTADSNLYVLSGSTATITEFGPNGSVIRSLSGIGSNPNGFDVDTNGRVYVAMTGSNQVWRFKPTTNSFQVDTNFNGVGYIGKTNGTSGSGSNEFNGPFDVAVTPDATEIAVTDSGNNRVLRFTKEGIFKDSFGQAGSGLGQFNSPKGLTYDDVGYLYIVDSGNNRVVLTQGSAVLGASGSPGTNLGQFQGAFNLSVGSRGIYIADTGNNRVQIFDPTVGRPNGPVPFGPRFAIAGDFGISQPRSTAYVPYLTEERFYIADTGNNRILLVKLPVTNLPDSTWNGMKQHLLAGDLEGGLFYYSDTAVDHYRSAFQSISASNLVSLISGIGSLTPVVVEGDTAQYRFQQSIAGQTITFPVYFKLEYGVWKIVEF
jgi:hypothetical protein